MKARILPIDERHLSQESVSHIKPLLKGRSAGTKS